MSPIEILLNRVDGVRQVAAGRWRARCPSHDGKNTNVLSIGEAGDGTVLVKCFHGCSASDVVHALGLELADLFPHLETDVHASVGRRLNKFDADSAEHHHPYRAPSKESYRRPRVDWPAMLIACERDMLLVKIMLAQIARGEAVNDVDAESCQQAATRVYTAIQEARLG